MNKTMSTCYIIRVVRTEVVEQFQEATVQVVAFTRREADKIALAQAKQGDLDGKFETYGRANLTSKNFKINRN